MKLYEITEDLKSIAELFESAVDSEGNPRELTEEEQTTLNEWLVSSQEDFEKKFDGYGKIISNLKLQSELADSERKTFKSEMDRLSARSKAFNNRVDSIKYALRYAMETLNIQKFKTALYSAGIQNTQMKIEAEGSLQDIPEVYLKPREINTLKIKEDIKNGKLLVKGSMVINAESGEVLEGIKAEQGSTLVIR